MLLENPKIHNKKITDHLQHAKEIGILSLEVHLLLAGSVIHDDSSIEKLLAYVQWLQQILLNQTFFYYA